MFVYESVRAVYGTVVNCSIGEFPSGGRWSAIDSTLHRCETKGHGGFTLGKLRSQELLQKNAWSRALFGLLTGILTGQGQFCQT